MEKIYFIIDFDSTFVRLEALDKLAEIALEGNPQKEKTLKKIKNITEKGTQGKLSFDKSLKQRLCLFKADANHIERLVKVLKKNITPSILRNREFFKKYKDQIYIISGGFTDYIIPVFKPFGIRQDHILANEFIFNKREEIIGFDQNNLLAQDLGKVKQIQALNLKGKVYVLGDGYTDYQIKEQGLADKFFIFCENIKRQPVLDKADYILPNFDEFLYMMDLPRAYSYPKNRIKVLLLENINKKAVEIFRTEGYEVEVVEKSWPEDKLKEKLENISILGIRSRTQITENVLKNAKRLLTIGAYCIGVNQIDLADCARKGIAVFNAPYANTRSVVELVLGEMIVLSRKIFDKSRKMHQGIWEKSSEGVHEIRGKKLGIVGFGNIGSQLSVLAENLGMQVYFYDVCDKLALGNARRLHSLSELLKTVDFVSVHVDGRSENTNLFGEKEFKVMKDGVIFINTSRGFVVDIKSLVKYLKSGKVRGAAIDVFPKEPFAANEQFESILQTLPNVILTPHIGGSTQEAQENIGAFVTDKLLKFINEGNTTLSVNFPNLQLPPLRNVHRLIHIHQNVPGVLAKINGILAAQNINIEGQYLKTEGEIGFVITDVNKFYSKEVFKHLKDIDATIKFRVLY